MPDPRVDGSPKGRTARIVGCALDKPGEAARPGGAVGAEATRRPVDAHPQRVGAAATGAPAAAGPRSRRHHPVRRVDAVVYLHVGWFMLWVVYNVAAPRAFDKFPFGLLTLIVSLEAIFLSTFVMISQNR